MIVQPSKIAHIFSYLMMKKEEKKFFCYSAYTKCEESDVKTIYENMYTPCQRFHHPLASLALPQRQAQTF